MLAITGILIDIKQNLRSFNIKVNLFKNDLKIILSF